MAGEREYGFLATGPVHPQQQALKNLDRAVWEALDRTNTKRFPRFKRKGEKDSLRYPDPLQVKLDLSTKGVPEWPEPPEKGLFFKKPQKSGQGLQNQSRIGIRGRRRD